jgi:protein-S-isoprenylcysteine O-methyltransferase Ste14
MEHSLPAYGWWSLVIINSLFFIIFAASFSGFQIKQNWRSLGVFSAFVVALFTEMYGFPLTVYLLSGWLARRYPGLDIFSHDAGHLWTTVLGMNGNPHLAVLHILSIALIFAGFVLLAAAWRRLYEAQRGSALAVEGPYARIRHPQYVGFVIIMFGFLLQWPTLPTLLMFPILVWVYAHLARREERDMLARFGSVYEHYMRTVPAFIPRFGHANPKGLGAD